MVADVGPSGSYHSRAGRRGVARPARCRWRWRGSTAGYALGANEPIADQLASSSHFDWLSIAQVVNIPSNAYPRTIGKGGRFIERGWELTGRLREDEADKEVLGRYNRGRNVSGYKCVRVRVCDYIISGRQYHRVSGRAIVIWVAPQYHRIRLTIQTGIGCHRSAPGDRNGGDHVVASAYWERVEAEQVAPVCQAD